MTLSNFRKRIPRVEQDIDENSSKTKFFVIRDA